MISVKCSNERELTQEECNRIWEIVLPVPEGACERGLPTILAAHRAAFAAPQPAVGNSGSTDAGTSFRETVHTPGSGALPLGAGAIRGR